MFRASGLRARTRACARYTEASTKHHGTDQGGDTCGAEESQLTAGLGARGLARAATSRARPSNGIPRKGAHFRHPQRKLARPALTHRSW